MALRFRTLILFWLINLIFSDSHILHTYSSRSESHSSSHINHNAIFCNHSSHKCIINCFNDKYCVNKIIVCPSDGKCEINCHVKHSCFNTSIIANSSNHLTVNAFYTYSTYYTNVYCPLSQNTHCQIYGHSQDSLQNVNIYINSYHQNYQIKCQQDDNECGDYNINNNNNNQHFHSRKLLAPTTSTLYIEPNITTTMSQQIKNEDLLPFGFNLNQATTAWILIIAVILIICLFCCVMGLCCCMCRQQKNKGTKLYVFQINLLHILII